MEKRFISVFSPNGSWVNRYLRKPFFVLRCVWVWGGNVSGDYEYEIFIPETFLWEGFLHLYEILPETCRDLIHVRNVPFHWALEVALRLRRIQVCWERVNLGMHISNYDIFGKVNNFFKRKITQFTLAIFYPYWSNRLNIFLHQGLRPTSKEVPFVIFCAYFRTFPSLSPH